MTSVTDTQFETLLGAPLTLTVNTAPGRTAVTGSVSVGPTLIVPLVASFVMPLLAKNRTLYAPGVTGAVNRTVAAGNPTNGAVVSPLRYAHDVNVLSGALTGLSPTQSPAFAGPPETVTTKDVPIVQGVSLMLAFYVIVVNVLIDLSVMVIDPRTRYAPR